jgi:hypothetical protein
MKMNIVIIYNFIPIWDVVDNSGFQNDCIEKGLDITGEESLMDYFLLSEYKFHATDDYNKYHSTEESLLSLFMLTFPDAIEKIIPYE